jgi:acetolactate synthase-1/2/3 large subunit
VLNQSEPMRAADYVIKRLADEGITHMFFLPGGGAMYLDDAMACEKRIQPILCHHEQACGIAAEAYGRTHAAEFGVAVVTTGPGATNILTPVAGAWVESLPLLILSGQVKRADALNGRPLRQSGVQEVDVVSMVKPITKYSVTVGSAQDIKKCLEEALWHMKNGRPGPVWLDIPLDVQAAPVTPASLEGFSPSPTQIKATLAPSIAKETWQTLLQMLKEAKRPLILAGHGVRISGAAKLFQQVVEALGIPCTFTWNAADLLPWDHPLYVGRPGVVAARAPNFAIQNCDCLIAIGCRLDNVITAYNPKGLAREAKKVVVDIDAHEIAKHPFHVDLPIQANAIEFLKGCLAHIVKTDNAAKTVASPSRQVWQTTCTSWKQRYPALDHRTFETGGTLSHFEFVDCLSKLVPENQLVITGSSGLAVEVFYTVFRNKTGQRMFLTSGLGSMGYGLPAAIGACLGANRHHTVCVESDGSLMLNLQELASLNVLNLPITVVVMNNAGYASIRNTQKNYFAERYLGTGQSSGLHIPNLVAIAKAMGIEATSVDTLDALEKAFNQLHSGPRLINVNLKSEEVLSPKVAALPQKDGSIISMPLEDMSPLLSLETLQQEMLIPLTEQSLKARNL